MQIIVNNTIREYSPEAILNLLRNVEFVKGILNGSITILGSLSYAQSETLFETQNDMDRDVALA